MRSVDRYVGVNIEGELTVHAVDASNSYATLCGLDGDDPDPQVGQSIADVPAGRKIDCTQCRQIWSVAKQYRASDFE